MNEKRIVARRMSRNPLKSGQCFLLRLYILNQN